MKLIRFGPKGKEKPGVVQENGIIKDASGWIDDYDGDFFAGDGLETLKYELRSAKPESLDPSVRLGPPVKDPSKVICVGLNYASHAKESGMQIPKEPVLFFKATTSITGPNDPVIIPKGSQKTDWEVELAVVIGKKASYVDQENAMDYVRWIYSS